VEIPSFSLSLSLSLSLSPSLSVSKRDEEEITTTVIITTPGFQAGREKGSGPNQTWLAEKSESPSLSLSLSHL
jgi:hypothetical protein